MTAVVQRLLSSRLWLVMVCVGLVCLQSGHDQREALGSASLPSSLVWVRTGGPPGGIGYDVRVDPRNPNIVYVTDTWAGMHKSTDGGRTWLPVNSGINTRTGPSGDAIPIFCVSIDPSDSNILWIGTQNALGVFRSQDGGASWQVRANGISAFPRDHVPTFRSFAVHPQDSNTVLAALEIHNPATNKVYGQIYKTADGGRSWRKVLQAGNLFRGIEFNPEDPRIVYGGTGIFDRVAEREEGIFKSLDGGETWTRINNGLANLRAPYLALDPTDPDVIYAATGGERGFGGNDQGGVFKTEDGGQYWRKVLSVPGYSVFSVVAVAPADPRVVYASRDEVFFRTTDGGKTWKNLGFHCPGYRMGIPIGLAVDPVNPDLLYLNSYQGGLYRSADGGRNWQPAHAGYTGASVFGLAIDPKDASLLYVAALLGVFKTMDRGTSYVGLNNEILGSPHSSFEFSTAIAVARSDLQSVFTATSWTGEVLKSADGGATWRVLSPLSPQVTELRRQGVNVGVSGILLADDQGSTIYVATFSGGHLNDDGALARAEGVGIFRSSDGGLRWQSISNGLPSKQVFCLFIDPQDPQILYAGTLSGVARTTNGGERWERLGTGINTIVRSLALDPKNPQVVWAGTGSGLFKTTNGGRSWYFSGSGMEPNADVRSIIVHPANPSLMFAADRKSGVYRSGNGGWSWVRVNEGLRTRAVNCLALSDDTSVLYAGTEGEGVFRLDLTEIGGR